MTTRAPETSFRLRARLAGGLYLLTIVVGVFAEVGVRASVIVRNDPRATAANILLRESWYRLGLVADLLMLVCYIGVTLLFYELFARTSRSVSLLAAFFSLVGIAVLAANALQHLGPLVYLEASASPGIFERGQMEALAFASLRMHARGYLVSSVFFGIYMLLLGWLIVRSALVPRALGFLMAAGGACFLINSIVVFVAPAVAARLPELGMVGGIAELVLSIWLIVMAVRMPATGDAVGRGEANV